MAKDEVEKLKCDPNSTKKDCRWRLRDPGDFKKMWTQYQYKKLKAPGLRFIVGLPKRGGFAVQAIRFDKTKGWTEKKAQEWWRKFHDRFEKKWKASDWPKWFEKKTVARKKTTKKRAKKKQASLPGLGRVAASKAPSGNLGLWALGLGLLGLCIYGATTPKQER
jgi:hypothetical protein